MIALILRRAGLPPPQESVVVMSPGIDHLLRRESMWQVSVRTGIAKAELQHRHAGNVKPFTERVYVGRDVAEIFGKKRQSAKSVAETIEQVVFGAVDPAAIDRRLFVSRNFPKLREAPKVIEPDVIKVVGRPAQAVDPPGIALCLHHIPPIKRITPALTSLAEEIRRHSGNDFGLPVGVQAEEVRVCPDIGAVKVHEYSDVPGHADRALRTIGAQRLPLLGKEKLDDTAGLEIVVEFGSLLLQCGRFAM